MAAKGKKIMTKKNDRESGQVENLVERAKHCITHHYGCDCREAMYKGVILEAIKEIEYWHADMLTEEERNHPRGNGWARVYDNLKVALHA